MARLKTRGWKQRLNMYQSSWFLKTKIKFFWGGATFQSTVDDKGLSISPIPTTLMAVPMIFCLHFCSLSHLSFDSLWCLFIFPQVWKESFSFHLSLAAFGPCHSIIKYG